jgi:hypothetical protein
VKIDTIQELNIKGNTVSNSQDIADHLHKFFSLVTGDNTAGFIKTDIGPLRLFTASLSPSLSSYKISCRNVC